MGRSSLLPERGKNIKTYIKILIAAVLILGAAFAAFKIITMAREYRAGKQTYDQLQQQVELPPAAPAPSADAVELEAEPQPELSEETWNYPTVNFEALKEQNADTVGWVYLEDTNINYPVVQGTDNRHYVTTLFSGERNQAGSIFMDYRNAPDMSDRHTVLYGHNMRNKTMFAHILNYQDQAYYDAHPTGMYITPEKNYRFDIVAGYVASLADAAWQLEFVTEEEVSSWIGDAMKRSSFQSAVQPEPGDRYITLSTCSYEFEEARFVLVGILREEPSK